MLRFLKNEDGATAVIFALALLPLLGSAGVAIDYGRAMEFREFARKQSDVAALAVASAKDIGDGAGVVTAAKSAIEAKYGSSLENLNVTGSWIDTGNYRLRVEASLKNSILAAVPGMPVATDMAIETVVHVKVVPGQPKKPKTTQLSHEAIDYNRIYVYCYNHEKRNDADKGRSKFVAIADNADPDQIEDYAKAHPELKLQYAKNELPDCANGEVMSYMLRNVRAVRKMPSKWDKSGQQVFEYYTDTTMDPDSWKMTNHMSGQQVLGDGTRQSVNMAQNPMLETILCNNASECRPKNEGGILPNDQEKLRTPAVATGECRPGRLMYYGWEDRRPQVDADGSDADYDDIRLVVECPGAKVADDRHVRIVK